MLKFVWNKGDDDEKVLDLIDTPDIVLVQSCNAFLKYHGLKNPDSRRRVKETIDALKIKAETEPAGPSCFDRHDLIAYIAEVEGLLAAEV